jgi:hypothetical protein
MKATPLFTLLLLLTTDRRAEIYVNNVDGREEQTIRQVSYQLLSSHFFAQSFNKRELDTEYPIGRTEAKKRTVQWMKKRPL